MKKPAKKVQGLKVLNIIRKKRDGYALDKEELESLIQAYTNNLIPDYQMSSFLMSVFFQGMNAKETFDLTSIMLHSGKKFRWENTKRAILSKHSTGGIGDKTSIILAPLLASAGVLIPMISGRALGHTGGTIDKLEAIPKLQTTLKEEHFVRLVSTIGVAMTAQTENICPADKNIYALRDVTATVESIPLIVSSILSKKLAEGFHGLVLDVKVGTGAFMKNLPEAKKLAKSLLAIGKKANKKITVLISNMSEPLGHSVGNAIEINECVNFLRQSHTDTPVEPRLYKLTMALATEMFLLAKKHERKKCSPKQAMDILEEKIQSGAAYAKFLELLSLQGGNTEALDDGLPLAPKKLFLKSNRPGYVSHMDAQSIGLSLIDIGGGRKKTTDKIDHKVGLYFHKHIGDKIKKGEKLVTIYANSTKDAKNCSINLQKAILITKNRVRAKPIILERIH